MSNLDNLIDINRRKGLPRIYRFNQYIRWFTLILGSAAIIYSIWYIFNITPETTKIKRIIPFIVLFLTLNSVLKNLFSLNSILFTKEFIHFRFIGRKSVYVIWKNIKKMEYFSSRQKSIKITYIEDGKEIYFLMTLSFPKMLEIVNSINELAPQTELDEFMKNVIITDEEKKKHKSKIKKSELEK